MRRREYYRQLRHRQLRRWAERLAVDEGYETGPDGAVRCRAYSARGLYRRWKRYGLSDRDLEQIAMMMGARRDGH